MVNLCVGRSVIYVGIHVTGNYNNSESVLASLAQGRSIMKMYKWPTFKPRFLRHLKEFKV